MKKRYEDDFTQQMIKLFLSEGRPIKAYKMNIV